MPRTAGNPTSIDLFCGAGGLTLGLGRAGFEAALGSDLWEPAAATFEYNFEGVPVLSADARDITGADLLSKAGLAEPPALVVGGPPCQGFSSAGGRNTGDERNTLVARFAELVAEVRPTLFVFENVEGFLTMSGGDFVVDLLDPLVEAGYLIEARKINVANFGVPQLRKRILIVGALGAPPYPEPTHRAHGAPGVHRGVSDRLPLVPSVADALFDLPPASEERPGVPSDHVMRRLSAEDRARMSHLGAGQTMRDLPEGMQHPSFQRRANRRVSDGIPSDRRGGAPAGLRRLRADEPSKAITGAASREFVHPLEDRPLTLRECARLQTFPDDFEFVGTQNDKAILIGNAVPPDFGEALGRCLFARALEGPAEECAGGLVNFRPTAASGVSRALREVEDRIRGRYDCAQVSEQGTLWG